MPRRRNERPVSVTIFEGADGRWHGYLLVGRKPNGKPDRRHRSGRTHDECERKLRDLEDEMARGRVAKPGRAPTVERYLTGWLAGLQVRYKTELDYRRVVRDHLIPYLGWHHLNALCAPGGADLIREAVKRVEKDVSASAARRALNTLTTALNEAIRAELIPRNPADLVKAPQVDEVEIVPLTEVEVRAVIAAIDALPRNRSRWLLALTTGLRQGECLALAQHRAEQPRLPGDVDFVAGTVTVREKLLRHAWRHGCEDPAQCARWRHGCARPELCRAQSWRCPYRKVRCRTGPCEPRWDHGCDETACGKKLAYACPQRVRQASCAVHRSRRGCPKPCPPGCTGHAKGCPQRTGGGLVKEPPKSNAGKRVVAPPAPVIAAMRADAEQQQREREYAGSAWLDSGLFYTTALGGPIDPRADYQQWCDILAAAGVEHARLHDARHVAATEYLLQGVDPRVVMDILGWSHRRMLDRYQHVVDELRRDAARRVAGKWWPAAEPDPQPEPDSATDHATGGDLRPHRRHLRAV